MLGTSETPPYRLPGLGMRPSRPPLSSFKSCPLYFSSAGNLKHRAGFAFRLPRKKLAGLAACLFVFATVLPAEVYQYTGVDYATVTGSPYATGQSVTASFTLSDPLAMSTTGFDAVAATTVTSWTINDGVNTLSDLTIGLLTTLTFSTDSMGNITDWYFDATNTGSGVEVSSGGPSAETVGTTDTDLAATGANSGMSTTAGSWQDTTPTPEPGTLGMMLAGSLLLLGAMRRRAAKASVQS